LVDSFSINKVSSVAAVALANAPPVFILQKKRKGVMKLLLKI
jgi:hypothetical protein